MGGIGRVDIADRPAENLVARLESATHALERLTGVARS
jgi:hypothetical protein